MPRYMFEATVSKRISIKVKANSLEEAIAIANREDAAWKEDPKNCYSKPRHFDVSTERSYINSFTGKRERGFVEWEHLMGNEFKQFCDRVSDLEDDW